MSECEANKDLVVVALKTYGSTDTRKLAECIESGKVHIGGCIPINEQVNVALQQIVCENRATDGPEARKLYKQMTIAIKAGEKALRRYEVCNREFHDELRDAVEGNIRPVGMNRSTGERLVDEIHRLKEKLSFKEHQLDQFHNFDR